MDVTPIAERSLLTDIYCRLALAGPHALDDRGIPLMFAGRPPAERAAAAEIADPARRADVSKVVGIDLAARLAANPDGRTLPAPLPALVTALLSADAAKGGHVVSHLAASVHGRDAARLAALLVKAAVIDANQMSRARLSERARAAWAAERLNCTLSAASVLGLDDAARCRLFVALAESIQDPDARAALARTPLFSTAFRVLSSAHQAIAAERAAAELRGALSRSLRWLSVAQVGHA